MSQRTEGYDIKPLMSFVASKTYDIYFPKGLSVEKNNILTRLRSMTQKKHDTYFLRKH